eukprot:TRINITY_DN15050_c0_g1_i1.p1 TRINITY_DN15050_c0_g1~~TRINITY_DN15050_c0_g1_i1.p1  ORF type:complete len:530 (-),score=41.76 TRINITY_DN15050_c0_g1_i1:40-1629(-)
MEPGTWDFTELLQQSSDISEILNTMTDPWQQGIRPLQFAIANNLYDLGKALLARGANPNLPDRAGRRPIHLSLEHWDDRWPLLLLQYGADPNLQDAKGQTALHLARTVGWNHVILHNGGNPNIQDANGDTPLHIYLRAGRTDLKAFLEKGADLNIFNNKRQTPLMMCSDSLTMTLLLEKGADAKAATTMGVTMLHVAAGVGDFRAVLALLKHGAEVNLRDELGMCPLDYACWKHSESHVPELETAEILLQHGANVNAQGKHGRTALILCLTHENTRFLTLLLSHGADPNLSDSLGNTPLHYVTRFRKTQMLQLLMQKGANPLSRNVVGMTPYDIASAKMRKFLPNVSATSGIMPVIQPVSPHSCPQVQLLCAGQQFKLHSGGRTETFYFWLNPELSHLCWGRVLGETEAKSSSFMSCFSSRREIRLSSLTSLCTVYEMHPLFPYSPPEIPWKTLMDHELRPRLLLLRTKPFSSPLLLEAPTHEICDLWANALHELLILLIEGEFLPVQLGILNEWRRHNTPYLGRRQYR